MIFQTFPHRLPYHSRHRRLHELSIGTLALEGSVWAISWLHKYVDQALPYLGACVRHIKSIQSRVSKRRALCRQYSEIIDYASTSALNATVSLLSFGTVARVGRPLTTLNVSGPPVSSRTLPISM